MSKRPIIELKSFIEKRSKLVHDLAARDDDDDDARVGDRRASRGNHGNPYLAHPVTSPTCRLQQFFMDAHSNARKFLPSSSSSVGSNKVQQQESFCEIEARLGILKVPGTLRRVVASSSASSSAALMYDCSHVEPRASMVTGVSRRHLIKWTGTGIAEVNNITRALGETNHNQANSKIVERIVTETVYTGYHNEGRICFDGVHPQEWRDPAAIQQKREQGKLGKMEFKNKLHVLDLAIPAASYDCRFTLSYEKKVPDKLKMTDLLVPLPNWRTKRVKRRSSYFRRDGKMAWQIDVTEVTTTTNPVHGPVTTKVDQEIEMELIQGALFALVNQENQDQLQKLAKDFANQAWFILKSLNPLRDQLDAEKWLMAHGDPHHVKLALAQCEALRRAADAHQRRGVGNEKPHNQPLPYDSPIGNPNADLTLLENQKFIGCMPVNFTRENLDFIQKSSQSSYYCSEKTDGVRHLLVFLENTAVLVNRKQAGKKPIHLIDSTPEDQDPFAPVLDLIKPGAVLDGEVVVNRAGARKPRPIFIVFDVLSLSTTESIIHLPFEQRLRYLKKAAFRTDSAARDMFDENLIRDPRVPLPLIRKCFVPRTQVPHLLSRVIEERDMRIYNNGMAHNHLTDGIIFQPNEPYVCGTDEKLLKWKYLDTVTIDVELMRLRPNDDKHFLRTACMGERRDTRVDLSRFVSLPISERLRMEADRFDTGESIQIIEVGLDPESGEWYYLSLRDDKGGTPNHIGTVIGSLLELSEHITTEELSYRMSVPAEGRDIYRKGFRRMLRGMLEDLNNEGQR